MTAGSGIAHSEFNASKTEAVNFLQIWVFPKLKNVEPRYEQKTFDPEGRINQWQTVVSPVADSGAVLINQDAWFSLGNLKSGIKSSYTVNKSGNGIYVFMMEGDATVNGQKLNKRDGLGVSDVDNLEITADSDSEILLIEVPMV
jgi:redox-sensitive bicupin YhaK (pirin superfamily)